MGFDYNMWCPDFYPEWKNVLLRMATTLDITHEFCTRLRAAKLPEYMYNELDNVLDNINKLEHAKDDLSKKLEHTRTDIFGEGYDPGKLIPALRQLTDVGRKCFDMFYTFSANMDSLSNHLGIIDAHYDALGKYLFSQN